MTTRHVTYLTVKGVSRDGERWIEGWATTPAQDRIGDIVAPEGAVYSLPLPLLFAHKHDEPIGSVVEASVTRAGIRIRAKLTAGVARAEEVWKLIQDGALTAVSIGFQALKSTPLSSGGLRFDQWSWHELSVVSVPANPDARISVGKSLCYALGEPVVRGPGRVLKDAGLATRLAMVEHQRLKPSLRAAAALFLGQLGTSIAKGLVGHVATLERRIEELERTKGLDLELFDTIADMAKRLEEVEGHAWKHKGYWREGARAQLNEVYTHNGSSWICNRATREQPHVDSADWTRLARAGRDGRDFSGRNG